MKGVVFDEVNVDREMDDGGDADAVLFVLDIWQAWVVKMNIKKIFSSINFQTHFDGLGSIVMWMCVLYSGRNTQMMEKLYRKSRTKCFRLAHHTITPPIPIWDIS